MLVSLLLVSGLLLSASWPDSVAAAGCQTLSPTVLAKKANPYAPVISKAAQRYGVNPALIKAVITIESCFKPGARGSSGEKGLMQLMPATARRFGLQGHGTWHNIHAGTRYLATLLARYQGNTHRAVAAYNAGEGNISPNGAIPNSYYVGKVMNAWRKFTGKVPATLPFATPEPSPRATRPASPLKASSRRAAKTLTTPENRHVVTGQALLKGHARALPWADLPVR